MGTGTSETDLTKESLKDIRHSFTGIKVMTAISMIGVLFICLCVLALMGIFDFTKYLPI